MSDGFNDFPCCALLHLLVAETTSGALSLSPSACLLSPADTVQAPFRLTTRSPIVYIKPSALPCSSFDWGSLQCNIVCCAPSSGSSRYTKRRNQVTKSMRCCQYKRRSWPDRHLSRAGSLPASGQAQGLCSSTAPWAYQPVPAWLPPPDLMMPLPRMRVAASCSAVCQPLQASRCMIKDLLHAMRALHNMHCLRTLQHGYSARQSWVCLCQIVIKMRSTVTCFIGTVARYRR